MKVAILGATSHIAKGLTYQFTLSGKHDIFLFARSPQQVKSFLSSIHCADKVPAIGIEEFPDRSYDVIINCVGIGQPAKLKEAAGSIFRLTEGFDDLVLDYLVSNPGTLYINFSSGAVYGRDFSSPAEADTISPIDVNHIGLNDFYRIAKINSEAKHRAFPELHIIDLRVYAYFSRFIDLDSSFFITDVISCLRKNRVFETGPEDMVRDYIGPDDLFALIERCMNRSRMNDVFDVYSLKPARKFEILDHFRDNHGLQYTLKSNFHVSVATGAKNVYYSNNRKAVEIGYTPRFTSLETIIKESKYLLP